MANIYYQPHAFGLDVIGIVEYNDNPDGFHFLVIWKETYGEKYYKAEDSGCSCPIPFDRFHSVEDLEPCTEHEANLLLL